MEKEPEVEADELNESEDAPGLMESFGILFGLAVVFAGGYNAGTSNNGTAFLLTLAGLVIVLMSAKALTNILMTSRSGSSVVELPAKITGSDTELCVLCHKPTPYQKGVPIDQRTYYIEGSGQLCEKCYKVTYPEG